MTAIFRRGAGLAALGIGLAALTACGGGGQGSATGGGGGTNFTQLFSATVAHDRCVNCHGFHESNATYTEHVQYEGYTRNCAACHDQPDWRAPGARLSFTGKTASEICVTARDLRFGGDAAQMAEHMKTSVHVTWAITDGRVPFSDTPLDRAPPQNDATWDGWVDLWLQAGGSCD